MRDKYPELYHFMLLTDFYSLLKSETFKLGPWDNLSMTVRDDLMKNCQHCRLNIDYEKLTTDGYETVRHPYYTLSGTDYEKEFRVTVPGKREIPNFLKYIIDVYIYTSEPLFDIFIETRFGEQNFIDMLEMCNNKNVKVVEN